MFFYESVNKKLLSWIKYERFHTFHTIILTSFAIFHQYSSIKNNLEFFILNLIKYNFWDLALYLALTGSKTPSSKFSECEEVRWEITARKCPIGAG
ncbi:hypothetical protein EKA14_07990 [Bacillus mycoides]|nr:hypothetical protein EKA14_07990 [Bacillus mycoides]